MRRSYFPLLASCWALLLLLPGCIDAYLPDVLEQKRSYLVVDGLINPAGVTTIVLSTTYPLNYNVSPPPETGAQVYIEQDNGLRYPLPETAVKGTYQSAALQLDPARRYHLRLRTAGGLEYASDYVAVRLTPPIDEVRWQPVADGLNLYVSSHDDRNATKYYRFDYEETWEIVPPYRPQFEYVRLQRAVLPIRVPYPTLCWGTNKSAAVLLTKTTNLTQDVVSDQLIRSLPTTASALRYRYSILVKQYALTPEEFAYWTELKKTTENIGTLFDPLPTQVTGNVHCLTKADELAFGFVGVQTVTEKRIFITRAQLPRDWGVLTGYEKCIPPDTVELNKIQPSFYPGLIVPITEVYGFSGALRGYTAAGLDCIDCRKRGTAVRPAFW